jgi:serine/threonine-protein kinase
MIGTKLGPYEILEQLGAGGMGEVWLAEDTRLGRKVAIKILPEQFASDPERLARFEQEARASAALNHPHIAAVYDVGHENGVHFMVQEHLEGRTLRAATADGRLPLAQALRLATEIVEALRAAHEAGIVHRDLKPDNVFVTPDRHAKVLDFGLAKLTEMAVASGTASASMSPTVLGTVAGQMMGTAGYMAPEQIDGVGVDARADLFAFGCVLYELTTGQQTFRGKNLVDTLHRVSNVDPDPLITVDGSLPSELQRILDKTLAKDPAARYQTAGDLAVDLRALVAAVEGGTATAVALGGSGATGLSPAMAAGLAAAGALIGALAFWALSPSPDAAPERRVHLSFDTVEGGLSGAFRRPLAISPDGQRIAISDENSIYLRELASPELIRVRGTENARGPVFSPDGESLAFFALGEVLKVPITGGAPIRLATVNDNPVGMHWTRDGTIVMTIQPGEIVRIPDTGGEPEVLVSLETGERVATASLLPGGEWLLFALRAADVSSFSDAQIVAQSLSTGERRMLVAGGTEPRYHATGHLTFARAGNLLAVPFDADRVEVTGGAVVLTEGFPIANSGAAFYDLSERGDLFYYDGVGASGLQALGVYDRDGNLEILPFEAADMNYPAFAPDGNRIAVLQAGTAGPQELWIFEIDRASRQRLTPEGMAADNPRWSADGRWIYTRSDGELVRIRSDFSGTIETIGDGLAVRPWSTSRDGRWLAGLVNEGTINIAVVDLEAGTLDVPVATPATELRPALSPEGRYLAYASNEGNAWNVYVRDLQEGSVVVASPAGGINPAWSPDGATLYFTTGEFSGAVDLFAAEVTYDPALKIAPPRRLFTMPLISGFPYNVVETSPDDSLRLVLTPAGNSAEEERSTGRLQVLLNWAQVLPERVRPRE